MHSEIARWSGFDRNVRCVSATWIYCEGGPKRGLHLSGGRSGDVVIFTGHGSRHYYRVVTRTQWTSTEGQVPVAVFDHSDESTGVTRRRLG